MEPSFSPFKGKTFRDFLFIHTWADRHVVMFAIMESYARPKGDPLSKTIPSSSYYHPFLVTCTCRLHTSPPDNVRICFVDYDALNDRNLD
jgi:hypothetical protein